MTSTKRTRKKIRTHPVGILNPLWLSIFTTKVMITMKDGFIKVAAATCEILVADCEYNLEGVLRAMDEAARLGVSLLVMPELCLTGYTCGDLFNQTALLDAAKRSLQLVARHSRKLELITVVGLPLAVGGSIYNCAAVVSGGKILGIVPKTNIPNYGEFYELRNFSPAPVANQMIKISQERIPFGPKLIFKASDVSNFIFGVEICEDLWSPLPPSTHLALAGATIICNLSASNETVGKDDYRLQLIKSHSARLVCGYIYADAGEGESTTDLVFAGHNIIAENGALLSQSARFKTGMTVSEIDVSKLSYERRRMNTFAPQFGGVEVIEFTFLPSETSLTRNIDPHPFVPASIKERDSRCEDILSIQVNGLKKRLSHSRAGTAVIGLSGGLDSTLALIVTVRAFDALGKNREDIIAITMPCFGTTDRTRTNAEKLANIEGVTLRRIDITNAVRVHFSDLEHDENELSVTYENAQARERTQVLMDVANASGGLVVGTGDLSELALGWATYNGDHMSMYGVNASVPKTLVRHIVAYEANMTLDKELRAVLLDILDTPVSPELLPPTDGAIAQKTEELVGPYELHDFFLYNIVRWGFAPGKVFRLAARAFEGAYSRDTIMSWLKVFYRRFFSQQFKRSCLPDGPKVGSVSLSPRGDWRMPSDAVVDVWMDELNTIEV